MREVGEEGMILRHSRGQMAALGIPREYGEMNAGLSSSRVC